MQDSTPGPFPAASSPRTLEPFSPVSLQLCGWTCIFVGIATVSCHVTFTTWSVDILPACEGREGEGIKAFASSL